MPDARIRLADSDLRLTVPHDPAAVVDAVLPGWGGTMRDGLGVRADRGGVEIAIVGGVLIDPVLGIRRADIGIIGGRIAAIGRAGNPDTMDAVDVVLDTGTGVFDARGLVLTPGGIDSHVHWLSPQVVDAAIAGGLTTLVVQDWGPVWNLGVNPPAATRSAWAALEQVPLNVAMLVRASSSGPGVVEDALRAGGAGLKIHEDVGAGADQIRCALEIADRHDVQLAIHTDGLNESLSVDDTLAAFEDRIVHLFHIEGAGGGHAPDLLELAGRERILTSSTTPTVPFAIHTEAEHSAMVAAVHLLDPTRSASDAAILDQRVRGWTMAAESVLHDLGVIPMLSSDSQGMGRIGEVVRRAFQCASVMKGQPDADALSDEDRVLRYLAKVTINPAFAHGLAAHVGSLEIGKLADVVLWQPSLFAVKPELVLKAGFPMSGASGDGNATTALAEPVRVAPQVGAGGRAPARSSIAFLAGCAMAAEIPTERTRVQVEGCRSVTSCSMVRNSRLGQVRVDPSRRYVTLDGRPIRAEPVESVPFSGTYLLG